MSILIVKNVRLAFPVIYKPEPFQGEGDPCYSAAFLLAPTHPDVPKIKAVIKQVASEKWGAKAEAVLKQLEAQDRTALRDGNKKDFDGYAGNLYINSRAPQDKRPHVIKRDKSVATQGQPGAPFGGCYVDTQLDIWAQDNGYGKRINATLLIVQYRADGPSFGGGTPADLDQMDDIADDGGDLG